MASGAQLHFEKCKSCAPIPPEPSLIPPNTTDPTSLYYNELGRFVRGAASLGGKKNGPAVFFSLQRTSSLSFVLPLARTNVKKSF